MEDLPLVIAVQTADTDRGTVCVRGMEGIVCLHTTWVLGIPMATMDVLLPITLTHTDQEVEWIEDAVVLVAGVHLIVEAEAEEDEAETGTIQGITIGTTTETTTTATTEIVDRGVTVEAGIVDRTEDDVIAIDRERGRVKGPGGGRDAAGVESVRGAGIVEDVVAAKAQTEAEAALAKDRLGVIARMMAMAELRAPVLVLHHPATEKGTAQAREVEVGAEAVVAVASEERVARRKGPDGIEAGATVEAAVLAQMRSELIL